MPFFCETDEIEVYERLHIANLYSEFSNLVSQEIRPWIGFTVMPYNQKLMISRYNLFTGCPQARTCTLILRGGAEQFIEETERSLHDAIMIVRRAKKNDSVVAGKVGFFFGTVCSG